MAENVDDSLSLEIFSRLVGRRFVVQAGGGKPREVELIEVVGCLAPKQAAKFESFSLVFRGPKTQALSQGTFEFEHAAIGRFPLFIVPISSEGDAICYQALFNRLVAPTA